MVQACRQKLQLFHLWRQEKGSLWGAGFGFSAGLDVKEFFSLVLVET